MRIINARQTCRDGSSKPVTESQQQRDMMCIRKSHAKAMKEEVFWDMFGGVIHVGNRRYQVVDN